MLSISELCVILLYIYLTEINKMNYDIIIIGAGPAGLSFARSLADTNLNILMIEKSSIDQISQPAPDGREIALTHLSVKLMKELGAWSHIAPEVISPIKKAKVLNGTSPYFLNFDNDNSSLEALGYLVPNYQIRQALYEQVKNLENVEILTDVAVTDVQVGSISLSNGNKFEASLIVAADSRFSGSRRKMGIAASMHDFSRVAIVSRMEHEKSHNQTAFECFHYGRTLAILPMAGNMSSAVITVSSDIADSILNMEPEQFNLHVQEQFKNRLGSMKLIGKRYSYPLVAVHAKKFVAERFALIGDAAVGMHPVTAHGFNLGLRGQNTLAKEIKAAIAKKKDIGSSIVLAKYDSKHQAITKPLYFGTNKIVELFTNDTLPAKVVRSVTLRFANHFAPIKRMITNKLTEKDQKAYLPFIKL
jgi:ubiquinone biosynthesis UbiH/UbiF/VisC/COQ6 family hydroxylase